jgi:ankyrin repeat protein
LFFFFKQKKCSGGATALHCAAAGGNAAAVRVLLNAGASARARDDEVSFPVLFPPFFLLKIWMKGALPIHVACRWGRAAAAMVLHPLAPELIRTQQGATQLHLAAASGDVSCLAFCLSVFEDSPIPGGSGFYAAHFAAQNGRVELVTDALAQRPALLQTRTTEGLSVRDVAMACGNVKFAAAVAALSPNSNMATSPSMSVVASAVDRDAESLLPDEQPPLLSDSVRELGGANQEMINRAVALFNAKPQKGVQFMIQQKLVEDSPDSIARFMFETEALSKKKIGELISENDEGSQALANAFLRQLDFAGKDFDAAIRLFLSKFMLPGEAQKIDRVMEMFASRFYAQNPGSIFANADTCYVRGVVSCILFFHDLFCCKTKKRCLRLLSSC